MKVLFVVQRYGTEVVGGAELLCRELASRLASRDHQIEVLTSCASSYVNWANRYEPGTSELDGVVVHRLPVSRERNQSNFDRLNARVVWGHSPSPMYLQKEWMRQQGPLMRGLPVWLEAKAKRYDVVAFITYLYYTTWAGLAATVGRVPTVLHPAAHDEPPLYLPLYSLTFRQPSAFAFSTQEEENLVRHRFPGDQPSEVIGIGTDLEVAGDGDAFRQAYGLEDAPYVVFIGRVDASKGSVELADFFLKFKERNPGPLKLVYLGENISPLPTHEDIILTGFVESQTRSNALAGTLALIQPSYFESFSMVLSEAWAHKKPALVQGYCEVLDGQARRSGGAIPYHGYAEFEEALLLLMSNLSAQESLGRAGRLYVEMNYNWDIVMHRYESLLNRATQLPRAVSSSPNQSILTSRALPPSGIINT